MSILGCGGFNNHNSCEECEQPDLCGLPKQANEVNDHSHKPPPTRTIEVVRPPNEYGVGVFRISKGSQTQHYAVCEIPCEIGGRGFAVHRLGMGTLYHVRVGRPEDCECECLGWLRWGRCKHVSALLALIKRGKRVSAT